MVYGLYIFKLFIFVDVEVLEGYVDVFIEVGGLIFEYYKVIVIKFVLDFMEDFNIDEKEWFDFLKKEIVFIKDVEIVYVKSKRELSGGVGRYLEFGIVLIFLCDF